MNSEKKDVFLYCTDEVHFYNVLLDDPSLPDMVAKALAHTAALEIKESKEMQVQAEREIVRVLLNNGVDHMPALTPAAITTSQLKEHTDGSAPHYHPDQRQ